MAKPPGYKVTAEERHTQTSPGCRGKSRIFLTRKALSPAWGHWDSWPAMGGPSPTSSQPWRQGWTPGHPPPSPFPTHSGAAPGQSASQCTNPLAGLSLSCYSNSFWRIMFILYSFMENSPGLIQICTLLIFPATSSELIQLEPNLISQ